MVCVLGCSLGLRGPRLALGFSYLISQYLPPYFLTWPLFSTRRPPHTNVHICVSTHYMHTQTHTLTHPEEGTFTIFIRDYVRERLPRKDLNWGKWWMVGWGNSLSRRANGSGTLKDKTQVNFLRFPGNNDNLRPQYFGPEMMVEIKPMSCANLLTFL